MRSESEDAMETSPAKNLSGTKRKGDFETEGERREKEAKIEEEEEAPRKLDIFASPVWGEDSFEHLDYYESSDAKALSDDDEEYISKLKVWNEHYREYKRQIIASKGFKVDANLKPDARYKKIRPVRLENYLGTDPDMTYREYFEQMVHVCLTRLNQDKAKAKEPEVEFVGVERGCYHGGPRAKGYVTFLAKETSDGSPVEYQAKCMVTMDAKLHPMFCRRAPPAAI